jgi:molybdate transport system regulatory protein
MSKGMPTRYDIKVRLFNETPAFGKGVVVLLEGVEKYGSLSKSYKEMHMAASKAWKILNRAEEDLQVTLVERKVGGSNGGSSKLTKEGKELITRYRAMMKDVTEACDQIFSKYFETDLSSDEGK